MDEFNTNNQQNESADENTTADKTENSETPDFEKSGVSDTSGIFKYNYLLMQKELEKKQKIRKTARIIGIPFVLVYAIVSLWSYLYIAIASAFGFSPIDAINFVNDDGIIQIVQIFLSSIIFLLPFVLAMIISGERISDAIPFEKPKRGTILPYFIAGLSFAIFSSLALSIGSSVFESVGIDYNVDFGDNPDGFFGIALAVIATAIVPALVEEFAFRGVILSYLLPFGEAFAVITSSVLFGVMHGNFEQMPFAFLIGLVLGLIRIKSGSMWICIFIHFANNLFSLSLDYILDYFSVSAQNIIYGVICFVALLFGIISIVYSSKIGGKELFSFKKSDFEATEKQKYKWFFSSVFIIIGIALFVLRAFSYFL